ALAGFAAGFAADAFAAGFALALGALFTAAFAFAGALLSDFVLDPVFALPRAAIRSSPLHARGNARSSASDTMRRVMAKRPRNHALVLAPQGRARRRAGACGATLLARVLGVVGMLVLATPADAAREVRFPIRLDDRFLTHELKRSVYTEPDGTADVLEQDDGCNSLVLS